MSSEQYEHEHLEWETDHSVIEELVVASGAIASAVLFLAMVL